MSADFKKTSSFLHIVRNIIFTIFTGFFFFHDSILTQINSNSLTCHNLCAIKFKIKPVTHGLNFLHVLYKVKQFLYFLYKIGNMELGVRLKELRIDKGLTLKEVSKKLGITRSALSNYEAGIRQPSFETLKNICEFFHVSADYLLDLED